MSQFFETTDPDVASEIIRQQYTAMRMQLSGKQTLFRANQTYVGRARVDRALWRMRFDGKADPFDQVVIVRIREGTVRYTHGDSDETYGPGDTYRPIPIGPTWAARLADVDSDVVVLDQPLVDEVAGAETGAAPVRLASNLPHSPTAAALLWRTSEAVATLIAGIDDDRKYPLVIASASSLLAASVLNAFPHTAQLEPTIEDRHYGHTATLRRAIAFIESHPDQPITVLDIAGAAFVTARAVQLAFRRQLDTTPMAYLRRVRLDRAHAALRAAIPGDGTTVTEVAMRWGSSNPSRFAANYRAAYGRYPHQTLHSTD